MTAESPALTDVDFRNTMLRSLRLLAILTGLAGVAFGVFTGWQSGLLVLIGAVISAASLWEWLRLMTAINQQMDSGGTPRPMGLLLAGFLLRLALTVAALYVSLKYLHGTVFALAVGLGLGVLSLTVQALRLLKRGPDSPSA